MDRETRREAMTKRMDQEQLSIFKDKRTEAERDVSNAIYSAQESGIFDFRITTEDAIRVWQLVESVRQDGFPEDLKM